MSHEQSPAPEAQTYPPALYPQPPIPPPAPRHAASPPPPPPPIAAPAPGGPPPEAVLTPEQTKALEVVENIEREHRELAEQHGWAFVNLDNPNFKPDPTAIALVPGSLAREHSAFPVELKGKLLLIAVNDPDDVTRTQTLRVSTAGYTVRFAYANPYAIRKHIETMYSAAGEAANLARAEQERLRNNQNAADAKSGDNDLGRVQTNERSSTSKILDLTIEQALREGASDIHFEPTEHTMDVRIRVDGTLRIINSYARSSAENLMTKIKVDSPGMRTDNFFVPDSGVMRYRRGGVGEPVDIRVEVTPVAWGSGAVMRLQQNIWRPLAGIGFSEHNEKRVRAALAQPDGVLLATGPTGSGKDLPVSTPVPTPTGWTTMGDLDENDVVLGRNGRHAKVSVAWPIIERPELYRITFADGQTQVAGRDHQWLVLTDGERAHTERRAEADGVARQLLHLVTEFAQDETVNVEEAARILRDMGVDEFVGGPRGVAAALGSTDHGAEIRAVADGVRETKPVDYDARRPARAVFAALAQRVRERFATVVESDGLTRLTTGEMLAAGVGGGRFAVPVAASAVFRAEASSLPFYDLGTWIASDAAFGSAMGLSPSGNDHVDRIRFAGRLPVSVTRSLPSDREDLLAGVLDQLGYVSADGAVVLRMRESLMRDDLAEVIRSLGIVAVADASGVTFRTRRSVFRRNVEAMSQPRVDGDEFNAVVSIEPVLPGDEGYEPTRCITVDSPDRTYLVGRGYLVTSNTTLMYSLVNERIDEGTKIITLENPIEYKVPSLVEQISVNFEQGMSFASGLRSILRRDPDVVLLGEIRDRETAETAIDAAMTGHLLLSTLHTNDAPGVVPRLLRMGIEPFLLSSALLGVVGQRLVKTLCEKCRVEVKLTEEMVEVNGFEPVDLPPVVYEPDLDGCESCRGGFSGRVPVHEVMLSSDDLSEAIAENAPQVEILRLARAGGMTTMRDDGWEKVKKGLTTIEEINHSTRSKLA